MEFPNVIEKVINRFFFIWDTYSSELSLLVTAEELYGSEIQ